MRAYVLSIGSELIQGHLTDTNATFLAQELAELGVELLHVVQVGDDLPRLVSMLRTATEEADFVVCTGGVGPTPDDLTREALAQLVGEAPMVDPALLDGIKAYFAGRGLVMPEQNAKQAWVIPSAEILPNPVGTAPGWFVRHRGRVLVTMPGVPREMHRMWREQAVPRLTALLPARAVRSALVKTLGIGESAVAQVLADLIERERPIVATYAKDDGVQVRITAVAATADEAEAERAPALAEVRARLGDDVYAVDETPLPVALAALLRDRGATLAIAEVGTGGRFASLMLSDPSTQEVVVGATVLPAEAEAGGMDRAEEARDRFGAALGLAVLADLSDPDERGLREANVSVAVTGQVEAEARFPLRAAFAEVQRRSALHAADVLRRALLAP